MLERSAPDIILISDDPSRADQIRGLLTPWFHIEEVPLAKTEALSPSAQSVFVISVKLEDTGTFRSIRRLLETHRRPSVFVFATFNSGAITKAKDLHAAECFVWPLKNVEFITAVRKALSRRVEESWKSLDTVQRQSLEACASTMGACFSQCRNGQDLPMDAVRDTTAKIVAAAGETPLETWLGSIEHYHDYTFTHCMFVCFTIVAFAQAIGIKNDDMTRLTIGALLHDIGKSRVPVAILDKPAKLNAEEWEIMRKHPEYSREILAAATDIDKDAVDMAVHHHEKLDGTGYPDGLVSSDISDVVRLTAIADVYSALVDKRSYKPGFPPQKALKIMSTMEDGLDQDFVKTFTDFIMSTNKSAQISA